MTLVAKGIYSATQSAIISVNNVHDSISLKRNGKARLHAGTGSAAIKTKLLDCEILSPGGEAIIHARLEEPMTLLAGDRVVLRSLNPVTTFAGGTVLSVDDYRLKRSAPGFDERLRTAKKAAAEKAFFRAELLAGGASVFTSADIKKLASGFSDDADSLIKKEEDAGVLFPLGAGWLVLPRAGEITKRITGELSRYHENNPYAWGMEPGLCCELVGLPAESFKGLSHLLAGDNLAVVRHGRLALPGFEPALSAAQIRLRELVVSAAREGGSNPPAEGDLLKSSGAKKDDMRLVVRLLVEDGTICVVGPNLVTAKVVDDCREKMLKLFEENSELELKTFRDATGTSRNFAVALLEKFDREGLTRREGNARLLVKNV
jgi:selenocysteine-specific elongation factor